MSMVPTVKPEKQTHTIFQSFGIVGWSLPSDSYPVRTVEGSLQEVICVAKSVKCIRYHFLQSCNL